MSDEGWIVPDWPAPAGVRALITTRQGGASSGAFASMNLGMRSGDIAEDVRRNRARLRQELPAEPLWLRQVHGSAVVEADGSKGNTVADLEADAVVAHRPQTVCAVLSADCLPVLLCDAQGSVVAAAHAGWRGLCAGVIERTVQAMQRPGRALLAYLGPAIGPAAYEVGPEVRQAFIDADAQAEAAFAAGRPGRYLADLYALARQRLANCGVANVHGGGYCTYTDQESFFSYRRDGATGRMASLIWLER